MMKHWMFRCDEVTRKASESLDHDLPVGQFLLVHIHLMMCRYCSRFYRKLKRLRMLSRWERDVVDPSATLSADARDRIKAMLKSPSTGA